MARIEHTLVQRIAHWANQKPNSTALHGKRDNRWHSITWSSYWNHVRCTAKALITWGHQPGESIAIAGANHPEWVQIEFGIQAARGICAPIYGTSTIEQCAYIVRDCGARWIAIDSKEQLEKFLDGEEKNLFPRVEKYISFFPLHEIPQKAEGRVVAWDEMLQLGKNQDDTELDKRLDSSSAKDVCLLIYTSGTTGTPKGVEVDHQGQLHIGHSIEDFFPQFFSGRRRISRD